MMPSASFGVVSLTYTFGVQSWLMRLKSGNIAWPELGDIDAALVLKLEKEC